MSMDLGVPEHARSQWDALHAAITAPTPCTGAGRDDWTGSEKQQERAAEQCLSCPVMTLCDTYARVADERIGTWGGRTAHERMRTTR